MPAPSPVTRVTSGRPWSRRTALTAGAGAGLVLTLGACTDDVDDAGPTGPGVLRPTAPPVSADTTLATEVARAIGDTDALLAAVVSTYPALRPRLVPLRRTHAAHLRVLDDLELPERGTPRAPQGGRRVALRATLRREQVLQRELDRACLAAESGSLATLLGGMSAALGQRLAVLGAA